VDTPGSSAARSRATRAAWALGAGALGANALLALALWRSSSSVDDTLAEVRAALAARPAAAPAHAAAVLAPPAESAPSAAPAKLDPFPDESRALARREIGAGSYRSARARAARVLASIDAIAEPERDELETRALYVIAEAWHAEARTREERAR
jgi:hypothetical protein